MQVTFSPLFKSLTKITISSTTSPMTLWALKKYDIDAKVTVKDW